MCGAAWVAPDSTTLKDQLKAALGGTKTYASAVTGSASAPAGTTVTVVHLPDENMTFCDEEQEVTQTVLALPQEYTALAQLLKDPQELNGDWDPAAAAQKFLPKKPAGDYAKLEKSVEDIRMLLDLQERKVLPATPVEIASTKKKLETTVKAFEQAKADTTVALAACELEGGMIISERENDARVARLNAAELRAEERANRLEEICEKQAAAWEPHLTQLKGQRSTRQAAWTARRTLLDSRHLEVREHISELAGEANQRAGRPVGTKAAVPVQSVNLAVEDAEAELSAKHERQWCRPRGIQGAPRSLMAQIAKDTTENIVI